MVCIEEEREREKSQSREKSDSRFARTATKQTLSSAEARNLWQRFAQPFRTGVTRSYHCAILPGGAVWCFPLLLSSHIFFSFPFFPMLVGWGLCAYVIAHTILPPMHSSPFNLPIELSGRPKRLPLNSGHHRIIGDRGQGRGRRRARWAQGAVRRPFNSCAETKHLGITIIQSLSWTQHVDKLLQCVSYKVYILKRPAYRCNSGREFVFHLYLILVCPVLECAGPVWDACTRSDCLCLELAQLSIVRANSRRKSSITFHRWCADESWPTLAWRRRWYKLFLFWQLTKGQGPPPLAVWACVSIRTSQTLPKRTIEMPLCRSELRRRSFLPSCTCIPLRNSLPLLITYWSSSSSFLS